MVFDAIRQHATWSALIGAKNDDFVDQLNHIYTIAILAIFMFIVSTQQYVGEPINCWCPGEFKSFHVAYVKQYCWVANTYFVPFSDELSVNNTERRHNEITYYQWVPFILAFMAFLFKSPNIIWRLFNHYSGINLDKIVALAEKTHLAAPDARNNSIKHIAYFLDRWIESKRATKGSKFTQLRQRCIPVFWCFGGKRHSAFLTGFYIFCKTLYCVNLISQFFLLNAFMSTNDHLYGVDLIRHFAKTNEFPKESNRFPRVAMCDFKLRQLQNVQTYTIQCTLPINLFNEKIFIFLWFWFVFLATLSVGSWCYWVFTIFLRRDHTHFVCKHLEISTDVLKRYSNRNVRLFTKNYLTVDGIFVLKIIGKDTTTLVLTDLFVELWNMFIKKPRYETKSKKLTNEEEKEFIYNTL